MSDLAFTTQDAQTLIAHAQSAPLVNLKHAEHISNLLQRFARWHEAVTRESVKKPPGRTQGRPASTPDGAAA